MRRSPLLGPIDPQQADNPVTPRQPKNGRALNDLIHSIEEEHNLGLQAQAVRSPNTKLDKPLRDIVYGQIQQCYWTSLPALYQVLLDFKNEAINLNQEERLKHLNTKLKQLTATPHSSTKTDVHTPKYSPSESLIPKSCKYCGRMVFRFFDLGGDLLSLSLSL